MLTVLIVLVAATSAYKPSSETTPWLFKLLTQPLNVVNKDVEATAIMNGFDLAPPDKTGAFSVNLDTATVVERKMRMRNLKPVCDDYFNDMDAAVMCMIKGLKSGRRTSVVTKGDFAVTQFNCYSLHMLSPTEMVAIEQCDSLDYSQTTMFCAPDQSAAVYCWNEKWIPYKAEVISISNSPNKFKVQLMVGSKKYGKFYNALDNEDALISTPKKGDFEMRKVGSTEKVKLKVKISKKKSTVTLSGKFPKKETCYELYFHSYRFVECMKAEKLKVDDFIEKTYPDGEVKQRTDVFPAFVLDTSAEFDDSIYSQANQWIYSMQA